MGCVAASSCDHAPGRSFTVKYSRFEDLPCWQSAVDLALRIRELTKDRFFAGPGDLADQMRRAALSVSNNIAEGFERGSTAELLAFLYIARGSAGEVRSMLRVCERCADAAHLQPEVSRAASLAESCSRQIRAWANSLQNSDIKEQRHLNDATRRQYRQQMDAAQWETELARLLHKAQPSIYPDPDAEERTAPPSDI